MIGIAFNLLIALSSIIIFTGYQINTQKSLAFVYNNNKKSKKDIKESIPLTTATKRIKHLGIILPEETKELYTKTIGHL